MNNKSDKLNALSIMSVCMIAASAGTVGATVQPMIEAFPDVPASTIRLVTTIPSMTGMIMTFLVGLVAGKKLAFRTICLLGSIFMLTGGVLPVFLTGSVYGVLACRLLLGIGTGCFGIRNALIDYQYKMLVNQGFFGITNLFCKNLLHFSPHHAILSISEDHRRHNVMSQKQFAGAYFYGCYYFSSKR